MPPGHRLGGQERFIEGGRYRRRGFHYLYPYPRTRSRIREACFRPSNSYPNWIETVEVPEAIVEMVAAGLGTSVLAGWAIDKAIKSKRIIAAQVGEKGISIPWFVAIRSDQSDDDKYNHMVAELLASWCFESNGFPSV